MGSTKDVFFFWNNWTSTERDTIVNDDFSFLFFDKTFFIPNQAIFWLHNHASLLIQFISHNELWWWDDLLELTVLVQLDCYLCSQRRNLSLFSLYCGSITVRWDVFKRHEKSWGGDTISLTIMHAWKYLTMLLEKSKSSRKNSVTRSRPP